MFIKTPYNTRRFTKHDKSFKQSVLIYIQTSTVQVNQYHTKCMRFSKMQLALHCYTAVLCEPISKLYTYKRQPYI